MAKTQIHRFIAHVGLPPSRTVLHLTKEPSSVTVFGVWCRPWLQGSPHPDTLSIEEYVDALLREDLDLLLQ